MSQVSINETCSFDMPEGFHVLSAEEKKQYTALGKEPDIMIMDPDRHMIMTFSSRKHNAIISFLADTEDAMKSMESKLAGPMKPYGYVRDEFFQRTIAGEEAYGFRYHYTAQNIPMSADGILFQKDNVYYYLYTYFRTELYDQSRAVIDKVLDSIR